MFYEGELVAKVQYLCSIQDNTNWFGKKQPLQQNIIVPTCTIIHPRLDVVGITDDQDIIKSLCNSIQAQHSYKDILLF